MYPPPVRRRFSLRHLSRPALCRGAALGCEDGHCRAPKVGFGCNDYPYAGLSSNSINSYTRTIKSFFSWCNEENITGLNIGLYKAEETIKKTYSDAERALLLKKPDIRKATFAEYRDWVIINFLLNCGSRAATVRAIQIRDVDMDAGIVFYRHTVARKYLAD